jgi:23S rRNA (cytosine1962-C5)-methyltransferase
MENTQGLNARIFTAMEIRVNLPGFTETFRLFNGFYEGLPGLIIDRYGQTLLITDHSLAGEHREIVEVIATWALEHINGLTSVLLKQRQQSDERLRNGVLLVNGRLPDSIKEYDIAYALDLQMNQDASFYLDTRNLRHWLLKHMSNKRVLNTFAYTGSLGVAAGAGGAQQVTQTDLNGLFLDLARKSWELNQLDPQKHKLIPGDFFRIAGRMRHAQQLYDCVVIDPPFFSTTPAGRVDLQQKTIPLVNKVRPLVAHEGYLVVINNALFLSGSDFMAELQKLCSSDYLEFEEIIPVPVDITGYPETIVDAPPVSPAPFNHPTKIAILRVYRKDQQK